MQKSTLSFLLIMLVSYFSQAQSWSLLNNSPSAGFRHDDIYFVSADTGWVVNVDGYIYKTTDGGTSWITQLFQPATSFRCVGFANANKGWAGNLGPGSWSPTTDTVPLYQTIDGGITWQPVTSITGPWPKGLCGISVVNDSVVYAVGRVGGPCYMMKTADGGASWTSVNFNPPAFFLIDCHFFSADTGLVAGCTGTNSNDVRYAIFYTTDGGQSWLQVASTPSFHGHCWKLNFPSRYTGYASVEAWPGMDSIPVLKTVDGGLTWQEKIWSIPLWYEQGIGFINDSVGWCGSALNQVKETTDGGDSWNVVPFAENFNRFRKINDTIAYACGNRIWKYSNQVTGINEPASLEGLVLEQNYPNPFSGKTTIKYSLPSKGKVTIKVYDFAGRYVNTLVNKAQNKGTYEIDFSVPCYFDTHFFYTFYFDNYFLTRQMLMVKDLRKP